MIRGSQPPAQRRPPAAATLQQRRILIYVVALVVVVLLVKACSGHQNQYEKIAQNFTLAAQRDDVKAVESYENAETASEQSFARVGKAAQFFEPYGKLKSVHEVKPAGDAAVREHDFTLTFDKGTVSERFQFDPQNKIIHFNYQPADKQ